MAPGETFLGRPGQQRRTKPSIPLLMHSYKYFTGKNLPSGRPRQRPGCTRGLTWAFAINTDEGNASLPSEMIPSETLCLILEAASFSPLWIKDGSASCNIDRDKLSTDCWDNRGNPGPPCAAGMVIGVGGGGLKRVPSVNYTPLGWARVSTVHKSSCQDALCSHVSRSGSTESRRDEKWRGNRATFFP